MSDKCVSVKNLANKYEGYSKKAVPPTLPQKKCKIVGDRIVWLDVPDSREAISSSISTTESIRLKKSSTLPQQDRKYKLQGDRIIYLDPDSCDDLDNSSVSDMDTNKPNEQRQSESDPENEKDVMSKPDFVAREFFDFLKQVVDAIYHLSLFKTDILSSFGKDSDIIKTISSIFRELESLQSLYDIIIEKTETIKSNTSGTFPLPSLFLDVEISAMLSFYKPFLTQYASNCKWIGQQTKANVPFQEACDRTRAKHNIEVTVTVDNCLYTVFNSLFSYELFFNRYSKCFSEDEEQYVEAEKVKTFIKDLLSVINDSQDQEKFFITQQELNLLAGRSKNEKINTRFIYKGEVKKMSRRDYRPLDRQFVLFSDCLYVTLLPSNITGVSSVRSELSFDRMEIKDLSEDEMLHSFFQFGFTIRAREAQQDFFFEDEQQMIMWRNKITFAVNDYQKQRCSIITGFPESINEGVNKTSFSWLGAESPRWQKDSDAAYCNGHRCNQRFTPAIRRHHCRADGLLYCDSCCNYKVKLSFERTSESRVCELCFRILFRDVNNKSSLRSATNSLETVFKKKTRTGVVMDWLRIRKYLTNKGYTQEEKRFCVLDENDPFINAFENREDKVRQFGVMLIGMVICNGSHCPYHQRLDDNQFCVNHQDKKEAYLFKAKTSKIREKWVESLTHSLQTWMDRDA